MNTSRLAEPLSLNQRRTTYLLHDIIAKSEHQSIHGRSIQSISPSYLKSYRDISPLSKVLSASRFTLASKSNPQHGASYRSRRVERDATANKASTAK